MHRPATVPSPTSSVSADPTGLNQAGLGTSEGADAASFPFPLAESWKHVRTAKMGHVIALQHAVMKAIREHLDELGFTELVAPILGPVTDPGIRGAKQASVDYYGHEYKIMSSAILYKQMMATAVGPVYFFSPNVRFEPTETATSGRHLVEFFQVDLEIPHGSYHDAMDVAESLLKHVTKRLPETAGRHLDALGIKAEELTLPDVAFPRLTHDEAIQELRTIGHDPDPDAEISWAHEKILSAHLGTPFFIHDYPKGSRGFYDMEDPDRPGILRDFDLLYDRGYGEAVSGAEREHTLEKVVARMRETGEDPAKYGWYVDMLREGIVPTAGFGIGLERLTRYVCRLDSILEARPYPKVAGHVSP